MRLKSVMGWGLFLAATLGVVRADAQVGDEPATTLINRGSIVCSSRCWGAGLYRAEILRPWLYGLDVRVISGSIGPCNLWGEARADSRLEAPPDELVDFSED